MAQKSRPSLNPHLKNPAFEVVQNHLKDMSLKNRSAQYGIDDTDMKIIQYMLEDYSTAEIAKNINKPLSTVQRRIKKILDGGYIRPLHRLNYKKFGLRRGLLYFKCKSANLQQAVNQIGKIRGVDSVAAYLGSLDVIANVVYADSTEVLEIIAKVQALDLIADVTWSEEIHSVPI